MRPVKRSRSAMLAAGHTTPSLRQPAAGRAEKTPSLSLADMDALVRSKIMRHLDARSLAFLQVCCKALVCPAVAQDAMRETLLACDSLPPPAVTERWNTATWLHQGHMAALTTTPPPEAEAYAVYVARGALSQYKWLRAAGEAGQAWVHEGRRISEMLDDCRTASRRVSSLDLSALFFPPFPNMASALADLSLTHVRFSTGSSPIDYFPSMPLKKLFQKAPKLQCIEFVPQKWTSYPSEDAGAAGATSLCIALCQALESTYAPGLSTLKLDFSQLGALPRDAARQALERAIAGRVSLRHVEVTWPE